MVAVSLEQVSCNENLAQTDNQSGLCYYGPAGSVVTYASNARDANLIQDMVTDCGYQLDAQPAVKATVQSKGAPHGIIVCHRRGQDVAAAHLLRSTRASRVLVISDCLAEETIVLLLNHGAHYYFDINDSRQVLVARIEAALKRFELAPVQKLIVNDICFDTQKRLVVRAGKHVDLSPKEYDLAHYLFSNIDRVVGNKELMTNVWSLPTSMDSRRIDTAACRIRKKLGMAPGSEWQLKRLRMVGYQLIRTHAA
ncbi:MAG: response regulator transcription factor [Granulosicoccus sp.]|nr:response regulator transcription factor [Granulosicoccus sp.]